MGDLPEDGGAAELKPAALHSTSFLEPNSMGIGAENWAAADKAAREIIRKVQPTPVSEERREEVVRYIQRLIKNGLGAEVFPYGSVPLKTYLPDGDIDLTAFGGANLEDTADDMKAVLEDEEKNASAEFIIKDVQLIRAEVKLVKCIVQDIVVDLSFNQIGGLCTLCFLEQVDSLIGKDHLFKRSIILIKAWCYYESRILGAYHGLISTYALETLVLYIFHFYHSTLDGPLAVLYKFLDYFSKFDWETYCISLNGPIRLSSLPAIVAEMPEDSDRDLLLSRDFLNYCVGMFSVPSRGGDKKLRGFQLKHLNIIDPLKENNNLGRSVSKGNFYRIRSAFSYGARKLSRILMQSQGSIANELPKFFANTMARHGGGQGPDGQDIDHSLRCNRPIFPVPNQEVELRKPYKFGDYDENAAEFQSSSGKSSQDFLSGDERIQSTENREPGSLDEGQGHKDDDQGARLCGDSNDLTTSGLASLKISTATSKHRSSSPKESVSVNPKPTFVPHLFFPKSKWHDYTVTDGSPDSDNLDETENNASGSDGGGVVVDKDEAVASSKASDAICGQMSPTFSGDPSPVDFDQDLVSMNGIPKSLNSLDLTGDYERYFQCLQYGRWCYERGLDMHSLPTPPMPASPYGSNSVWDNLLPFPHYKQNGFSRQLHNNFHPNPAVYGMQQPVRLPGVPYGWEDAPKPRGTGTYFPNMVPNVPLQGIHSPAMKGRNQALIRSTGMNGRNVMLTGPNMRDRSSHELSQPQAPIDKTMMLSPSDSYPTFSPRQNGYPNPNALFIQPDGVIEFELSENSRAQRPVSSSPRTFSGSQRSPSGLSREQDRISLRSSSYRLKDEDDFPPLSM